MRSFLAYLVCRISKFLLTLIKKGGSKPGELALKIDPLILTKIKYPKDVILVTATNGKTSTTNLIAQTLIQANKKVIYNYKGDNMQYGIATLLLSHSDVFLNVKAEVAVIEIDELTLARFLSQINANYVIVNNFFRDQLDRSGEMESVVSKIETALEKYCGTLVLNHDDPNVYRIKNKATMANIITYHLAENSLSTKISNEASEGKFCPVCHDKIQYAFYQYSHLGKYQCVKCGFGNDVVDVVGNNINIEEGSFTVDEIVFKPNNISLYHFYNCLAAIVIARQLNVDTTVLQKAISQFKITLGRNEEITLNNKKCLLNLVKNPTGCNEILKMISKNDAQKSLLFVLNDNEQDSRDVSWIWDVDFERLENVDTIVCSGMRAYEIALRLKYGGIQANIIVKQDIKQAIDTLLKSEGELYVLATYTALPKVRREMYAWN